MIVRSATCIAERLCEEDIISVADKELYAYGFFLLISKVLFFAVAMVWGLIWNVLWESIVFYIAFSILRQYAGGYHAKTERICLISTNILLFTCISAIKLAEKSSNVTTGFVCLFLSAFFIYFLSPLDTASKPLNKAEKHHYKVISCSLVSLFIGIASIATLFQSYTVVHVLSVCTTAESILLIIGYSNKRRNY